MKYCHKLSAWYRLAVLVLLAGIYGNSYGQKSWTHGLLQSTPDGHYLQFSDGTPFFWLGDTGWELFHRLTRKEIDHYLSNRSRKGFTVIQAVILAEFDGLAKPNRYGQIPLNHMDPDQPNDAYFGLVDYTVKEAAAKNLFMALLPAWGDKVFRLWGKGPVVFNPENAYRYGKWLANRYSQFPNIIWVLGGDRPAFVDTADFRPIWRAMARGLREGSGNRALITYHPWGEHSSTDYWPNEDWLDVNMLQSGHARRDIPVWEWIWRDRKFMPARPILDGEPNYEDHPINWNEKNGYFNDYDVRRQIYRSVFAGACGVTYGHHSVWQFFSPREEKVAFAKMYWTEAIDRPAAFQAGYLRTLIESRSVTGRIPDQSLLIDNNDSSHYYAVAFRDSANRYAMIYQPASRPLLINGNFVSGKTIRCWWFNPRTGKAGRPFTRPRGNHLEFHPPDSNRATDWVLVLDDARYAFDKPGK